MDVELEKVEEGVVYEGDGAVDLALDAVVEFQGAVGLVAGGEGDPLDLVVVRLDVFARLTVSRPMSACSTYCRCDLGRGKRRHTHELRFMHSTLMGAP